MWKSVSLWGKYEDLAQYLMGNMKNIPREVSDQILAQIFPHEESYIYEEYYSQEKLS